MTTPLSVFVPILGIAAVATYFYGYRYRDLNLYLSAGVGQLAWGWCALIGGTIVVQAGNGPFFLSLGSRAFQYLFLVFFLVSALVFMLAHWGVFPPGEEGGGVGE